MGEQIIGQVLLNQYRVDAFIASGGMSAVYRVWDLKRGVPLAMKVLHADLVDDPSIFKRFQREARALQRLRHPNIVPFYGLYKTQDFPFLLEHFVDGPKLTLVLRRRKERKLSVEDTLPFLNVLSGALGYAHAHGVVHCDLKPGNVMVDRGGAIYLTDFGIARHAESTVTTLGFAGTAPYMAPEQIRGEAVSPQTDVYAMGVMLFEMLTGRRPFRGDESGTGKGESGTSERIQQAHLHLQPPDLRKFEPGLPEALSQVILRALAKDPGERFQSVREMFEAVCAAVGVAPQEVPARFNLPQELVDRMPPAPDAIPPFDDIARTPPSDLHIPARLQAPPVFAAPPAGPAKGRGALAGILVVFGGLVIVGLVVLFVLLPKNGPPLEGGMPMGQPTLPPDVFVPPTSTTAPVQIPGYTPNPTSAPPPTSTPLPTNTPPPTSTPGTQPGDIRVNLKDGAQMVFIPSGEIDFGMSESQVTEILGACVGCEWADFEDSFPQQRVSVGSFWIYRTEVTNEMYRGCVAQGSCAPPARSDSNSRGSYYGNPTYDDYPVIWVDWYSADQYCRWAGGRLPAEPEWDRAARGSSASLFPWGDQPPTASLAAIKPFVSDTVRVGAYSLGASPYGVLDMAGNVFEWLADWYEVHFRVEDGRLVDPGETGVRSLRGGSWFYRSWVACSGNRDWWEPYQVGSGVGFRCVQDHGP